MPLGLRHFRLVDFRQTFSGFPFSSATSARTFFSQEQVLWAIKQNIKKPNFTNIT
jgi:hypothetical protein